MRPFIFGLTVIAAMLMSPSAATAITFGQWATSQGYSPNDAMPEVVFAPLVFIDDLDGIGDYNWTTTPTITLVLAANFLSSIETGDFDSLPYLTSLGLDSNQITSIDAGDFGGLTNLTELDLRANQISSIASGAFSDQSQMTVLNLTGNPISTIGAGAFSGLSSLPNLDLEDRQLSHLVSGTFNGLSSLTELGLARNLITNIDPNAFSGLSSLPSLDLRGNQLSAVAAGTFNGLTSLTELLLNANQIASIAPNEISRLANLQTLTLNHNQLSSVGASTVSGLANLTSLVLNHNQIATVDPNAFDGLANLQTLNLNSNQIASIDPTIFDGLTNLTDLSLSFNQITSVDPNAFDGLANLQTLGLVGNPITTIKANDFAGMTNLVELGLGGFSPGISTIEPGAFRELANLKDLFLVPDPNATELNLSQANFSSLDKFSVLGSGVTSVTLENAVLNQGSLAAVSDGIASFPSLTELDLSGIDFAAITDLSPLYVLDDLTDLWLVDTVSLDAADLDVLLNNLDTIEGTATEGILHMTQANFDALNIAGGDLLAMWHGESGHRVELVLSGDFNRDGVCDGTDFLMWQLDPSVGSLTDWEADYGQLAGPPVIALSADSARVPEPAGVVLGALAGVGLLLTRRRHVPSTLGKTNGDTPCTA